MNMFVRIFFEGRHQDVPLNGIHGFSVGCGQMDNFRISSADLTEKHIVVSRNGSNFEVRCNGSVYLSGKQIRSSRLVPAQIYILSRQHKVSMLVIQDYGRKSVEVDLSNISSITIGRNPENDIVLTSPMISGQQARLSKVGEEYHIQDLQSMNGTYINGRKENVARLTDGTEIIIGDLKAVYKADTLRIYGVDNHIVMRD